ncbi:MAG: hypothetical protein PHS17_12455 [Desulfobacterales bacterium]|nr:hypothetical protein [Desulfobacterales bacterium]
MRRIDTAGDAEAIQIEIFRAMGAKDRLQAAIDLGGPSEIFWQRACANVIRHMMMSRSGMQ